MLYVLYYTLNLKKQVLILSYNRDMTSPIDQVLTTAQTREVYGMTDALDELEEVASNFGLSDLVDQVDGYLEDVNAAIIEWVDRVIQIWYDSAPWATGNLRESIDYDDSDFPNVAVGVDVEKLMARAGQVLPMKRKGYTERGIKEHEVPKYADYPIWVDEGVRKNGDDWNASSASLLPNSEREYWFDRHTPFIDEIWFEQAMSIKKEIFGDG